ncbi:hypothetical protein [Pseudoruegeria sp. HB172150]|uniref:hypothetical protein n=1 Tax=Pseudoruegeria sp. HB172150 TaxID=2721164 RepID=UPI0020A6C0EE|nr:hypothetical protein [Pseudoruegeria sp. HB172150]
MFDKLRLRNDAILIFCQQDYQVENLRFDRDRISSVPQFVCFRVEFEVAKGKYHRCARIPCRYS